MGLDVLNDFGGSEEDNGNLLAVDHEEPMLPKGNLDSTVSGAWTVLGGQLQLRL